MTHTRHISRQPLYAPKEPAVSRSSNSSNSRQNQPLHGVCFTLNPFLHKVLCVATHFGQGSYGSPQQPSSLIYVVFCRTNKTHGQRNTLFCCFLYHHLSFFLFLFFSSFSFILFFFFLSFFFCSKGRMAQPTGFIAANGSDLADIFAPLLTNTNLSSSAPVESSVNYPQGTQGFVTITQVTVPTAGTYMFFGSFYCAPSSPLGGAITLSIVDTTTPGPMYSNTATQYVVLSSINTANIGCITGCNISTALVLAANATVYLNMSYSNTSSNISTSPATNSSGYLQYIQLA